jgi:hypothetical protein
MPADALSHRPPPLLVLAIAGLVLATLWSIQTAPAPNSDRYDYAGRAYQATQGHGLSALTVYPVRFALASSGSWPLENLSRPPLWPVLLVPGVRGGLDDATGVIMASLAALLLLWLLQTVGDRGFGRGAGGVAALALITSFTTVRALWGGGPEMAMTLVTFLLWTWSPAQHGTAGYVACGSLYGLLPLLHPVGWFFALLALLARSHRYSERGRWILVGVMLLVGLPWYLRWWMMTGSPAGFLQGQAELAKAVLDPAGLGPYRTLDPTPGGVILREHAGALLDTTLDHLRFRLLRLDAWLTWPWVILALVGIRRDVHLAVRDVLVGALGWVGISVVSAETRLLLPLLPVACAWCGAGYSVLAAWRPRVPWWAVVAGVGIAPWVLPLGAALRPAAELRAMPDALRSPPPDVVEAVGGAGDPRAPMFVDSAVLAWRTKRPSVLLPDRPVTLESLRRRRALRRADILVLSRGRDSPWLRPHRDSWERLLDDSEVLVDRDGYLVVRLPPAPAS